MKLTSPNLNYFIIAGALLMYTAGITQVTPSSSLEVMEHMCRVSETINSLHMRDIAVCTETNLVLSFNCMLCGKFRNPGVEHFKYILILPVECVEWSLSCTKKEVFIAGFYYGD